MLPKGVHGDYGIVCANSVIAIAHIKHHLFRTSDQSIDEALWERL